MPGIHLVIPFGRGGASDRAARCFADALGTRPRDLVVENLPGAGGRIGVGRANALARSGATVLLLGTPTTHILLRERLGDANAPAEAFRPLIGLGSAPGVLLASPELRLRSVAELVSRARRKRLVYASAGIGQTIHLITALFCRQAGIDMTHIAYDGGSASAYADLIAGRVDVYFDNLLGCHAAVTRGDAVAVAVSGSERSHLLPDVPTLVESGISGTMPEVWLGIFGTHGEAIGGLAEGGSFGRQFVGELEALGLSGGPLGGSALAAQVERSVPGWKLALRTAEQGGPQR